MNLISEEQTFLLAAALLALATFGFWAETTTIGRKLSGALIILVLGVLLSNVGLIPNSAPMYGTVSSLLVPLAIPMLLFRADLKQVLIEIGPMLKAFIASAVVIGFTVIVVSLVFDFGQYEAQVAGSLAASYIGGSLNFVATAQAVELTEPSHYIAALTADTIGAVFFLALLMSLPALSWARKAMPSRYISPEGRNLGSETLHHEQSQAAPFDLLGLTTAAALAAGQGWRDLVTPGMLAGILGYSVATFIGVGVTQLLSWL